MRQRTYLAVDLKSFYASVECIERGLDPLATSLVVADLSRTEWKVIRQIGKGLSNKEIAAKLYLSEGTVRNYLSSILGKLSLRDRTQLAIWAVQTGAVNRLEEDEEN